MVTSSEQCVVGSARRWEAQGSFKSVADCGVCFPSVSDRVLTGLHGYASSFKFMHVPGFGHANGHASILQG